MSVIAQILLRRGTAAEWAAANPVLALGEPGWDSTNDRFKVGNGHAAWDALPFIAGNGLPGTTVHHELSDLAYADAGHTGFAPTAHTHAASDVTGTAMTLASDDTITGKKSFPADGEHAPDFTCGNYDQIPALKIVNDDGAMAVYGSGGNACTLVPGVMLAQAAALETFFPLATAANMREPTGFVNRTDSTLAFAVAGTGANQTRIFTISPAPTLLVYSAAATGSFSTPQSVAIPDVTGLYYVYFSTAFALTCGAINTPWDIPSANVPVATVYWNAAQDEGLLGDERHGIQMDGATHEYNHDVRGAAFVSGLSATVTDSALEIGTGEWRDEDIVWEHAAGISGANTRCRMMWRQGTAWHWGTRGTAYYHTDGGIVQYNPQTGTPALAAATNHKFFNTWVFATNHVNPASGAHEPFIGIMGVTAYDTAAQAQAATADSLALTTLPASEMLLLYRITWQSHETSVTKVAVADYRRVSGGPIGNYVATDHAALTHLDAASSGHTGFALTGDIPTRDSLGLDTDDSPQFAGINLGHASDTTLTREASGFGDAAIEGNHIVRMAGTPWDGTLAELNTAGAWSPFGDGGELSQYPHAIGWYRVTVMVLVTGAGSTGATFKLFITHFPTIASVVDTTIPMANHLGNVMTAGACPLTTLGRVYHGSALFYTCNSGTGEEGYSTVNMQMNPYTPNGATADCRARLEYLGA